VRGKRRTEKEKEMKRGKSERERGVEGDLQSCARKREKKREKKQSRKGERKGERKGQRGSQTY
jgi:hypothetical protein